MNGDMQSVEEESVRGGSTMVHTNHLSALLEVLQNIIIQVQEVKVALASLSSLIYHPEKLLGQSAQFTDSILVSFPDSLTMKVKRF